MLREIIHADTGIIFDRHKLMKFGVPDTEFAPRSTKLHNANATATQVSPPKAKIPQQPTVSEKAKMAVEAAEEENDASEGNDELAPQDGQEDRPSEGASDGITVIEEGAEEEVPWWYRDAIEPMRDELLHQPFWWLLEWMPFYIKRQDEHSEWKKHLR